MNNETKKLRLGGVYNFVLNTEKRTSLHGDKKIYNTFCGRVDHMDKGGKHLTIIVYSFKCDGMHYSAKDINLFLSAEEIASFEPVLVSVATL